MTDDDFRKLANTFGFAPSRALRELIDCATKQALIAEREARTDLVAPNGGSVEIEADIRARGNA